MVTTITKLGWFRLNFKSSINQVLMFGDEKPDHPLQIGAIDPHCNVTAVLEGMNWAEILDFNVKLGKFWFIWIDAYTNAKFLCDQYYLCSPDIEFVTKNSNSFFFCLW